MSRNLVRWTLLPLLLAGTAMLGGCYVVPLGPRYAYARPGYVYPHYWGGPRWGWR